ncbi:MAG TPA: divalent-cation tolerance protein CutA [Chlamydiales bacterium]|nr:divalent-cation tolerance protein CutA [Chlamydiales bacterium]
MIYIFWSCRDETEAKRVVYGLLEAHLIACASILPRVESIYHWEGKIEESQEVKVILKTTHNHYDTVQKYIQSHCSYEVPEIVQIDIADGNPTYLSWIKDAVSCPERPPDSILYRD